MPKNRAFTKRLLLGVIVGAFFWTQLMSQRPILSLQWVWELWPALILWWLVDRSRKKIGVSKKTDQVKTVWPSYLQLLWLTTWSAGWQACLGLWQYGTQHSLFPWWLSGEPLFRSPPLAVSDFWPSIHILPLGGTPHPNILGGWLVVGILAGTWCWKMAARREMRWTLVGLVSLQALCLVLTESLTAIATLLLLVIFFLWRKHAPRYTTLVALLLLELMAMTTPLWLTQICPPQRCPWGSQTSIVRRSALLQASAESAIDRVGMGSGMNQHLLALRLTFSSGEILQFRQPLHSAPGIFVLEVGFWVTLLILLYFFFAHKTYSVFFALSILLLPIFSLDHYAMTTMTGHFLFVLLAYFLFFK